MLVAAGVVPLNWFAPPLTTVLYAPGLRHTSGIWKPETLSAAHGGEVGLTAGLTFNRIARVPATSLVAGAVLVARPTVSFFAPEGIVAVPAPARVAELPSAAVVPIRAPARVAIGGLKMTGRPTSLGENSADADVIVRVAAAGLKSVMYRADVGGTAGLSVRTSADALLTPVNPPTQPVQVRV